MSLSWVRGWEPLLAAVTAPKLAAGQGDPRETLLPGRGMPVSPGRMGATWCADCKSKQVRIEYSMGIAGAINSGWYKSLAETLGL